MLDSYINNKIKKYSQYKKICLLFLKVLYL